MNAARHAAVQPSDLRERCRQLLANGGSMHMAWAWFPKPGAPQVLYLAAEGPRAPLQVWRCDASNGSLPSLSTIAPSLSWYEREISDLCGVRFDGHPKPEPLVLQEGAAPVCPPLAPDYPPDSPMSFTRAPIQIPFVVGKDVQELPFGPVRADVMESAQFLFFYLGEHILHYQPRLFFKHRGMEKRFERLACGAGAVLAERVSGTGSVAHTLAYCQAVEQACGCAVPPRAQAVRVLLAELERLYNHLHYFGHLADTTTLKVGNAEGKWLEEKVKQLNGRLTGSRLLRNIVVPGGLRTDVTPPAGLSSSLESLREETAGYLAKLAETNSYLDRLITTGELTAAGAWEHGATGPVARASGIDQDLRRDHGYALYPQLRFPIPTRKAGDANARAQVRAEEILSSFGLIDEVLQTMPGGAIRNAPKPVPKAEGLGWAESPRGALFYAVHLDTDGRLARVKIGSPSFANWRVFQYTVRDSNMMDYAINEASFGLTVAGCDR
ncbi:MAG: NADH-quinone oxidoreductase subunit C [Gammaproteobacteria bacterium]|nr:NADH-quinone oxidoreductase subunit C [Gammaproteobacteria bacterium]MDE2344942.1 NADH-quinone oxidoreductase subunit C [Gammaproteobacteria bacterium]